jgi:murein DD-endopeptidase MepM/ murein hydrolase activator NlpD
VIDFHKDPRQGDRLGLVLRKLFKDGVFLRDDRVLLARYDGEIVSQLAVFYETEEGSGYYDENGTSVERMFLLSPLSYRRISSGFSHRRFHPVLKRRMPHLGMDFAADTGTKVWATARGTVSYAGRKGGYGKLVEIEHPNGYKTRYAHLSRISVRKGQRVDKFKTVGRVGATGRATGPHLHYELLRNGRHRNPASVNRQAKVAPLPEDQMALFFAYRDRLVARAAAAGTAVALQNPGR